jgi:hypothetical protein
MKSSRAVRPKRRVPIARPRPGIVIPLEDELRVMQLVGEGASPRLVIDVASYTTLVPSW